MKQLGLSVSKYTVLSSTKKRNHPGESNLREDHHKEESVEVMMAAWRDRDSMWFGMLLLSQTEGN